MSFTAPRTAVEENLPIPVSQQIEESYLDCLLSATESVSTEQVVTADGAGESTLQPELQLSTQLDTSNVFQCRLLHSCGISIAVPLNDISQIIDIPESLEINNRMTSLCYAKFTWKNTQIFVLRMEAVLFDHIDDTPQQPAGEQKIILLKNKAIAFMGNEVPGIININPCEVTWRDDNSKRLWLAGMMTADVMKEPGYAILDTEGLLQTMINWSKKT